MAVIICEGPDGAGKSYTADFIKSAVSLPIFPTKGPPKTPGEIIKRVKNILEMDNYIFDRFSLISEMVYGPTLRQVEIFDPSWLNRLDPSKYIVIYCRPPRDTIHSTLLRTKPHKSGDHVVSVNAKRDAIISEYDYIMSYIPHKITFNRVNISLEKLCAELTSRLEKIR